MLIDPVGCPDLSGLGAALRETEWVLHAATQDLPCLRDIGMAPTRLFDTELAGRLAGFARVGLGPMVEKVLGYTLEKGHSAVDWSTRPLPEPWLRYATLDVELLVDLRDALEEELDSQGKLGWALEEFAAIAAAPPAPPRRDPWRRTSGMHKVRRRRQLAVVRELWTERDRIAQQPRRLARQGAARRRDHRRRAGHARRRRGAGRAARVRAAAEPQAADPLADGRRPRARACPTPSCRAQSLAPTGPPPPRAWADKDPDAAARLSAARAAVTARAEELNLPQENLITPDTVRRVCWEPPVGAVRGGRGRRAALPRCPRVAGRPDRPAADRRPVRARDRRGVSDGPSPAPGGM